MTADLILIILGIICIIFGFIGCILPVLPGPPLSYLGILLLDFTSKVHFSLNFMIGWAVVVTIVTVLDYFIPVWGTKKLGGSKNGVLGSTIGVFLGIFIFPPWGIIICPFIGAVVGELLDGKEMDAALKAGFGSFLGFLTGTLLKLIVASILGFIFFYELFKVFFENT